MTNFVAALKDELEATLKNPVTIYFDENPHDGLLETHQVRASLDKKLKCLVFIPIISQTYCDTKSFAWEHELLPFLEMAREDELGMNITLANGNVASRVLPVQIHDLDSEDQSVIEGELGGPLRSIKFIHQAAGVNRPLNKEDDQVREAGKILYSDQTNKVANALKEIGTGVLRTTNGEGGEASEKVKVAMPETIKQRKYKISLKMILGFLFLPLVVAGAYYLYLNYSSQQSNLPNLEKSIAVLPFVDMSPNKDQQYFSDGISEELINALVKIPNLKVAGRTSSFSYRGLNKNLKLIGTELAVATILEGSFRKSGNQLRISAQLINANDGFNLWSETFNIEFTDIFTVQDQITEAIIAALNVHLLPDAKPLPKTGTNQEAYTTYLRARRELAMRGEHMVEAANLFKEAISLDPNFAPAYSGLGKALSVYSSYDVDIDVEKYNEEAKTAAKKALELEPDNAEAYLVLGAIAAYYEWDWEKAEKNLLKSVALSPNDAEMYNFLGDFYCITLNKKLAIEMESKAVELDPLFWINHINLGWTYIMFEEWGSAFSVYQKFGQLFEDKGPMVQTGIVSLIGLNRIDEARLIFDEIPEHFIIEMKSYLAISQGKIDSAILFIKQIPEFNPALKAERYLLLEMWEEAAVLIEQAYKDRDIHLVYYSFIKLPEDYPDHPALQKAFDKPELNALFEIRRKNLKNNALLSK